MVSSSSDSKSLVDVSVDAEIQHMLQALSWKTELSEVQLVTPEFSREAYKTLLETNAMPKDTHFLFENMGGSQSR